MSPNVPPRPDRPSDEIVPIGVDVRRALEMLGGHVFAGPNACLRELVANAADSIAALPPEQLGNVEIRLVPHPGEGRLSLSDSGVGMTREEARKRLGTIFHSSKLPRGGAIGRFGIGFYSCFPLCTRVEVHTRTRHPDDPGTHLVYQGGGELHLAPGSSQPPGTRVDLHLRPEHRQLLEQETLAQLVERDCDFVPYPICLGLGFHVLNRLDAPWYQSTASTDQIGAALREIFGWGEPLLVLSLQRPDPSAIRGALMVAKTRQRATLRLYSHRVLIREDATMLLPETLSPWVAGVVDVQNLPLVLSRDAPLEGSAELGELRRVLIEHLADGLASMARHRRRDFRALLGLHGRALKEACLAEPRLLDRLHLHLEFRSSLRDSVTLDEYLATRTSDPKTVIYADDPGVGAALIPLYNRSNIEVLFMEDGPQDARLRTAWSQGLGGERVVFQRLDVDPPTSVEAPSTPPEEARVRNHAEALRQLFRTAVDDSLEIELRALGRQAPTVLLSISDEDRRLLGFVDQVRHLARRDQLDQLPEEVRAAARAGLVDRLVEGTRQTLILNASDPVVEHLVGWLEHSSGDVRAQEVLPRLARFLHGQALLGSGRQLLAETQREIAGHQQSLLTCLLDRIPNH